MQQYGVKVDKKSSAILQVVVLRSPKGTHDSLFLSNYMLINIRDTISRIPGVGQANLFGQQDYAMRIWLDMDRLTGLGLTPQDVIAAVRAQNVQAAVGRIGGAPVIEAQQRTIPLTTQGRLETPEQFGAIIVRAPAERLADPPARRGPYRTRRAIGRRVFDLQQPVGRGDGDLSGAGGERGGDAARRCAKR